MKFRRIVSFVPFYPCFEASCIRSLVPTVIKIWYPGIASLDICAALEQCCEVCGVPNRLTGETTGQLFHFQVTSLTRSSSLIDHFNFDRNCQPFGDPQGRRAFGRPLISRCPNLLLHQLHHMWPTPVRRRDSSRQWLDDDNVIKVSAFL